MKHEALVCVCVGVGLVLVARAAAREREGRRRSYLLFSFPRPSRARCSVGVQLRKLKLKFTVYDRPKKKKVEGKSPKATGVFFFPSRRSLFSLLEVSRPLLSHPLPLLSLSLPISLSLSLFLSLSLSPSLLSLSPLSLLSSSLSSLCDDSAAPAPSLSLISPSHSPSLPSLSSLSFLYLLDSSLPAARTRWQPLCSPRHSSPGGRTPSQGSRERARALLCCSSGPLPSSALGGLSRGVPFLVAPRRRLSWRRRGTLLLSSLF